MSKTIKTVKTLAPKTAHDIHDDYMEVPVTGKAPTGTARRYVFVLQLGLPSALPKDPEALDDLWHIDIEQPDVRYVVYQREQAPETGQLHIQGYIEFTKPKGFRAVQKILDYGKPWVAIARGSQEQCVTYCTKEETRHSDSYWEHGTPEEGGRGARNDLKKIKTLIEEAHANPGSDPEVLVGNEDFSAYLKYNKAIRRWFEITAKSRTTKPEVRWYYGPAGVGKSARFWQEFPDGYDVMVPSQPGGEVWFERYNGQHAVLIEDFGGEIPFKYMLKLLDRYPMKVAVKTSSTQFRSGVIVITSDKHPLEIEWGVHNSQLGDRAQLIRRIDSIVYIGHKGGEYDEEMIPHTSDVLLSYMKKVHKEFVYVDVRDPSFIEDFSPAVEESQVDVSEEDDD